MVKKNLVAIDLFCGAGGLSLGLSKAGFNVVGGVEIDKEICETYKANHRNSILIEKDIRDVKGKEILESTKVKKIHLLAGCPPCQGFSQLTEKYKREDPRNFLPLEMARLVEELSPEIVMMENVPGIVKKGKEVLDNFIKKIEEKGYIVNYGILQVADYGVPQSRRRFVLLAGKGFKINLPLPTHGKKPNGKLKEWIKLKDVFKKIKIPIKTLSESNLNNKNPQSHGWHVVRDLSEISKRRLQSIKEGEDHPNLPENLKPKCHKNGYVGFKNVYGRLSWGEIAPTITSGCTTLSMGRFGHPSEDRTISVKEALLIQSFPINYKLKTNNMGKATIMVGNAFPPKLARILGKQCLRNLEEIYSIPD